MADSVLSNEYEREESVRPKDDALDPDEPVAADTEGLLPVLASIAKLSQVAAADHGEQSSLEAMCAEIRSNLHLDFVAILERAESGKHLMVRAGSGLNSRSNGTPSLPCDEDSFPGNALLVHAPVTVSDLRHEQRAGPSEWLFAQGAISGVAVAIGSGDSPFGVLVAHSRVPMQFSPDQVLYCGVAADLIRLVFDRRQADGRMRDRRVQLEGQTDACAELIDLLRDVALSCLHVKSLSEAISFVLKSVSEQNGWVYGQAFEVMDGDRLRVIDVCYGDAGDEFRALYQASVERPLRIGQGLPGRILASGLAELTQDVAQDFRDRGIRDLRMEHCHTLLGFPVVLDSGPSLILEFLSREPVDQWPMVQAAMEVIVSQLVHILSRCRAAGELRGTDGVLNAMLAGVLVVDHQGHPVGVNRSAQRLFGRSLEQCQADGLAALIPVFGGAPIGEELRRMASMQPAVEDMETLACNSSGAAFPIRLEVSEGQADGCRLFTLLVRDLPPIEGARDLALREGRLATSNEIVSSLAHESRNALQRGQACLNLLELKLDDRQQALALIDDIQDAQDTLKHLYEDLSGFAAPLGLERTKVDLESLIDNVWNEVRTDQTQHVLRLHIDIPGCLVRVDPVRMSQVLRNLFANAIEAASENACIDLTVSRCGDSGPGPRVSLRVRDHGVGLDADGRARIFELFYTTKTNRTGLGMPIARRIVEAHGGRLQVHAAGEQGVEFEITLPDEP